MGWVGGASSSKKGLSVYIIRDDKIMKIWLASDVLLTLIFTHHRLTLVCANEAPIYPKKESKCNSCHDYTRLPYYVASYNSPVDCHIPPYLPPFPTAARDYREV